MDCHEGGFRGKVESCPGCGNTIGPRGGLGCSDPHPLAGPVGPVYLVCTVVRGQTGWRAPPKPRCSARQMEAIGKLSDDMRRHFRMKLRNLFTKFIRKFGSVLWIEGEQGRS